MGRVGLFRRSFSATAYRAPVYTKDGDEQAAYAVAAWLKHADQSGSLGSYFNPPLTPDDRSEDGLPRQMPHRRDSLVWESYRDRIEDAPMRVACPTRPSDLGILADFRGVISLRECISDLH